MDKYKNIPMCCGTPMQDNKCILCGSDYSEEEKEVYFEFTDSIRAELNEMVETIDKMYTAIGSLKGKINSTFVISDLDGKIDYKDLDDIRLKYHFLF